MLNTKKSKIIAAVAVVVAAGATYFTTKAVLHHGGTKTYTLSNVALVVSNSDNCGTIFNSLSKLAEQPLKLQFSSTEQNTKFNVKNSEETLKNHSHTIVKQDVSDTVYRVGTGAFELDGHKVEYVITTSTDVKNENYKHLYPVILSGDSARCYFTALIAPDAETTADFIKDVKSGDAAKAVDLSNDNN